jgi:hypothetical protein
MMKKVVIPKEPRDGCVEPIKVVAIRELKEKKRLDNQASEFNKHYAITKDVLMSKSTLKFSTNFLWYRNIRNELNKAKFSGFIDDFIESSGIFSHEFVVKGDTKNMLILRKQLMQWADS